MKSPIGRASSDEGGDEGGGMPSWGVLVIVAVVALAVISAGVAVGCWRRRVTQRKRRASLFQQADFDSVVTERSADGTFSGAFSASHGHLTTEHEFTSKQQPPPVPINEGTMSRPNTPPEEEIRPLRREAHEDEIALDDVVLHAALV
jgi:hypothetical protein